MASFAPLDDRGDEERVSFPFVLAVNSFVVEV